MAMVTGAKAGEDDLVTALAEVAEMLAAEKAGRVLRKELLDGLDTALTALSRIPKGLSAARMASLDEALDILKRIREAAMALPSSSPAGATSDGKAKAALVPPEVATIDLAWACSKARILEG